MIVDNFNINWPLLGPLKTNAPLIVDANRVLTHAITFEFL
jgi:hypothetical protein